MKYLEEGEEGITVAELKAALRKGTIAGDAIPCILRYSI